MSFTLPVDQSVDRVEGTERLLADESLQGWPNIVAQALADPAITPSGARLAIGAMGRVRELQAKAAHVAFCGTTEIAFLAGIDRSTLDSALAGQPWIRQVSRGQSGTLHYDSRGSVRGESSQWTADTTVGQDLPIAVPDPVAWSRQEDARDTLHRLSLALSPEQCSLGISAWWTAVCIFATRGLRVEPVLVTGSQVAAWLGSDRSTGTRTLATLADALADVGSSHAIQRTRAGSLIDMQALAWGICSLPEKSTWDKVIKTREVRQSFFNHPTEFVLMSLNRSIHALRDEVSPEDYVALMKANVETAKGEWVTAAQEYTVSRIRARYRRIHQPQVVAPGVQQTSQVEHKHVTQNGVAGAPWRR